MHEWDEEDYAHERRRDALAALGVVACVAAGGLYWATADVASYRGIVTGIHCQQIYDMRDIMQATIHGVAVWAADATA